MIVFGLLFLFALGIMDLSILISYLLYNVPPPDVTVFHCWIFGGLTLTTVLFFVVRNCFHIRSYRIVQVNKLQPNCCEHSEYYIQYCNKFLCFKWWLYLYSECDLGRLSFLNKTNADEYVRYLLTERKSSKKNHPPTI